MSNLELVNEVLALSGPFVNDTARRRHEAWLRGKPTHWLLARRLELNETSQRPAGQRRLALERT